MIGAATGDARPDVTNLMRNAATAERKFNEIERTDMTDKTEVKEPTKAEADRFQKLADAYEKDGAIEPGYGYRYVTSGGETRVVVEKL